MSHSSSFCAYKTVLGSNGVIMGPKKSPKRDSSLFGTSNGAVLLIDNGVDFQSTVEISRLKQ